MGPALRGRRMPFASWLAGPRGPRSVEPPAAVCLEEPSRQRGALSLGLVVGALGKPYASAQAGRVKPKPELFMFWRELVAALPLASLALRSTIRSAKFLEICSVWPRLVCDTPVIFSGLLLAVLRHFLQIFSFFYQLISTQIRLPHRRLA